MSGLLWPIAGAHNVTQWFDGHAGAEPSGWLGGYNGKPWKARKGVFAPAVPYLHLHMAIDIACPIGTPILAPEGGVIVAQGTYASTGEHYSMLRIHRDATLQTVLFFTHIKNGGLIHPVGSKVARGATLALSGNSGMSTGPHLHWEVRVGSVNSDPHLSAPWYKYNPQRLRVGGDMAGWALIKP